MMKRRDFITLLGGGGRVACGSACTALGGAGNRVPSVSHRVRQLLKDRLRVWSRRAELLLRLRQFSAS